MKNSPRIYKPAGNGANGAKAKSRQPDEGITPPEAYYESARGGFWIQDNRGIWMQINDTGLKRFLKASGVSPSLQEGSFLSPLDSAVLDVQQAHNVDYAGPLAGYPIGLHDVLKSRVLVTAAPTFIVPAAGDWPVLRQLLQGLLSDEVCDQSVYVLGWLKVAVEALMAGQRRPGQALAMAGPPDCGKSLLQKLFTLLLGGRMAKPYQYMTGDTPFNAHLFTAEHLVIEDEAASTDIAARREFGAHLKDITVNEDQSCHAKHRQPLSLTPFWRLSISVNDEPENLMVLPPLDESIEDKLILLRAHKRPMPMPTTSLAERGLFWKTLVSELPAFVNFLRGWEVPNRLLSERFGITHFHHPELLRSIDDLAPEHRLLSLIEGELFRGPLLDPWEGTANELERRLTGGNSDCKHEAQRLLRFNTACGVYLGRLAKKDPKRITKRVRDGLARWEIKPPGGSGG